MSERKYTLANHNGYIVLVDPNGNILPRQTELTIRSVVGAPLEVNMKMYLDPAEIDSEVLEDFKIDPSSIEVEADHFISWYHLAKAIEKLREDPESEDVRLIPVSPPVAQKLQVYEVETFTTEDLRRYEE